jgi:hypothetical protein
LIKRRDVVAHQGFFVPIECCSDLGDHVRKIDLHLVPPEQGVVNR